MSKQISLITIVIFLVFNSELFSQGWIKLLPDKDETKLTLYDYQNAFNKFWAPFHVENGYYVDDKGNKRKAAGWKQFKRWEYYWEQRVDKESGKFPVLDSRDMLRHYLSNNKILSRDANWTQVGPNSSTGGYAGVGRINCITFHPSDNNVFWVGTASGGIWKTSDGGSSWTVLNEGTAVLGVSDILVPDDYVASHTIYIATGDRDGWDNNSIGVLKSTDDGSTWNTTGLTYSVANGKMVNKLIIDPNDNQIILAATKDGVYKTTDGGTTWNTQLSSKRFIDLEYKPGDFNTIYAGTRYDGEIWRSTDGGSNWAMITNTNGERVELAVSPDNPSIVYALISASDNGLKGVYKSTNGGASFNLKYNSKNLLGWESDGSDAGGQGWYDLSLAVNPADADMVFVGGVNTWRSTNGASSFSIVNHWSGDNGTQAVHADKHRLKYRSNGDIFECNDGGIYISIDDGAAWTDKTNGMQISQIYKIGVAQTVDDDVITGLQDNGTKNYSAGSWDDVIGGDGMDCAIDFTDENTQYGELYYGDLKRTTNHWSSSTSIQPSGSDGAWVTPFVLDPNDHNTIIAGYEDVYKSTNQGNSWSSIYNLNSGGRLRTLDIAPSNSQYIYTGEKYTLWKTTNGGSGWSDITSGLPGDFITDITVSNDDENTLWVTLSNYNGNTVWESTNAGNSWYDISTGLPSVPVHNIIQNKLNTTETELYAATDNGVYVKKGNGNWTSFNNGLPNVEVRELEIYYDQVDNTNCLIRAGTYGRGLWESILYEPVPPDTNQSRNLTFYDITTNKMTVNWTNGTGDKRIVKINTSDSFSTPADGSNPPANTVYGGGEQVVFNGENGSVTVTNLSPSTSYFFRVYDYTGTGISTVYNTAPGINNPNSVSTYCQPSSSNEDDDYIKRLILNKIDNTSGETDYTDFTDISTALLPGQTYDVSVEVGGYNEHLNIWIDMNDNQQFEDSEKLIDNDTCFANSTTTFQISIPQNATLGKHILRARVSYYSAPEPCEEVSYGEGEDYTVDFKDKFTWEGNTSSDWFDATNWDVGKIPSLNYEVIIPNTLNQASIGLGQTANAKKITAESGAELIVNGILNLIE